MMPHGPHLGDIMMPMKTAVTPTAVTSGQYDGLGRWIPAPVPATGQVMEAIIEIPLVTFGTALLLFSSLFIVLALNGAQRGNRKMLLGWLAATLVCGIFFVGMQVYEFNHFVHKGLTLSRNMFGASFYVLTGFHGTHVTIGVIWLLTMFILALRGKITPEKAVNLEIAALYWHFVDVVWIVIFPVVYLIR